MVREVSFWTSKWSYSHSCHVFLLLLFKESSEDIWVLSSSLKSLPPRVACLHRAYRQSSSVRSRSMTPLPCSLWVILSWVSETDKMRREAMRESSQESCMPLRLWSERKDASEKDAPHLLLSLHSVAVSLCRRWMMRKGRQGGSVTKRGEWKSGGLDESWESLLQFTLYN